MRRALSCLALAAAAACATGPQKKAPLPASDAETPTPSSRAGGGEAEPKADSKSRAELDRALELARRGDYTSAESELRQLVNRSPELDYGWTDLGVVYEREALPQQAERAYRKALEIRPDQEEAWSYLARLYCRTGRASQIEGEIRSRIQQSPDALGMRTALVFVLIHDGKLDAAADEAKKILKADERNVRAMQFLAQVYYRQGKYELSKMVLENAKAIDSKDAATFNELGLVNLALKAKPAALENFKQAVALKPDFAEAKNNLGALLNESQDYDAAIRELEGAVNAAPDFAQARLNLGNAYRGRQEPSKALSQYQQVARLQPDLADTYFNLAILHLDSELPNLQPVDRLQAAISYFNQYRQKGGRDERVDQYLKDAAKAIEKEQRRAEREHKEQLKKASEPKDNAQESTASPTALAAKAPSDESVHPTRSKKKAGSRKRRTVVSPNTPASNQSADAEGAPAPRRSSSSKLAGQEN